jgi:hypothetical protein
MWLMGCAADRPELSATLAVEPLNPRGCRQSGILDGLGAAGL